MSDKRSVYKFKTIGQQKKIDENRKKYPHVAKIIDDIRVYFPGAKVVGIYKKGYFRVNQNEDTKENKSDCSDDASITQPQASHTPQERG